MAFKIKDGLRIGTTDVFASNALLLVNAPTASKWLTPARFTLGGDLSGYVDIDGSANVTLNATIAADSIALGTDTTGNYVQSISVGTGLSGTGLTAGEGTTATLSLAANVTTAGTFGNASYIPTITVDTYGRVTSITENFLQVPSSTTTLTGGSGSGTFTTGNVLTFTGGTGITTSISGNAVTITNAGVTSVNGSTGAITNVAKTTDKLSVFAATTSAELAGVISDETGSGALVFSNSPALVTPDLGTPSALDLTNANNLSITKISGLGTGISTFLQTPSSTNLASAITDESGSSGSGKLLFSVSPQVTTSLTTDSSSFDLVNTTATTVNFAKAATSLSIGAATGTTTVNNDVVISGNLSVQGNVEIINSQTVTVADKNILLGNVANSSNTTANGGGITIAAGASDKTLNWINATASWTSSENFDLASGKVYKIGGTDVLTSTALGSGITGSSLTSVGTIVTGVWQGSEIATTYTAAKVTAVNNGTGISVNASTGSVTVSLAASGVSASTYGAAGIQTVFTVDTYGRITSAANVTATVANSNIVGNIIASQIQPTGVTASTYGSDHKVSVFTVDQQGRITSAANVDIVETSTLSDVTGRGNTTTNNIQLNSGAALVLSGTTSSTSERVANTIAIATTSATPVDTWVISGYRSAKYLIQVSQGTDHQVSEVMVIHNGTTTYMTEYAVLETNGVLVTFTSDVSSGKARLIATMAAATAANIKIDRTAVTI